MKAWTFLLVAAELFNYLVLVSSSGFSDAKLARDYLESLNESAAVIANCGNVTHIGSNNHFSNALLVKLLAYDLSDQQSDLDDASALLTHILEINAIDLSFGGLFAAPLLMGGLGAPLPASDLNALKVALYGLLPASTPAEPADVCYTNIFLMNTANLILLGEALADYGPNAATSKAAGLAQWNHWLNYTRSSGLHEFDSPTYTAVQTNALYNLHLFSQNQDVAKDAGSALNFLWHGIAASWFAGGHSLAGPHSRDYDTLFGKGMLNGQLSLVEGFASKVEAQDELYRCEFNDVHCEAIVCPTDEGLSDADIENCQGSGLQAIYAYINFVFAQGTELRPFLVPPSASALARTNSPMVIQKRWQEGPAGDYYLYRERNFAMGLISDDYNTNLHEPFIPYPVNAQDKVLSISFRNHLPQDNPLPVYTLVPDWREYGVYGKQVWEAVGKPVHLRMRPTAAQAKGTAVVMLAIDPSLNETSYWAPQLGNATRLALNQILPIPMDTNGSITLDGKSVDLPSNPSTASSFTIPTSALTTVGFRQEGTVTVARIFTADDCGGGSAGNGVVSQLRGDSGEVGGLLYHTIRLETVLYDGEDDVRVACSDNGLLKIGLIIAVQDISEGSLESLEEELNHASVNSTVEDGVWSVAVTVRGTAFDFARNLTGSSEANEHAILRRLVDGEEAQPPADAASIVINGNIVAQL